MKGQNLRITIGGKYVAFAQTCTLHVSQQLESNSTKDNTNDFETNEVTGLAWDISADALYSVEADTTGVNGVDAIDLVLAKQTVEVQFVKTEGTKNRVPVAGSTVYKGNAYVNDISVNSGNRANVTYTIQLTGNGELQKVTAPSSSDI